MCAAHGWVKLIIDIYIKRRRRYTQLQTSNRVYARNELCNNKVYVLSSADLYGNN